MFARFFLACLIAFFPLMTHAADPVTPTGTWAGKIRNNSLRKHAPKSGFIADAAAWKGLWKAWQPKQKLPEVDFKKELVLVATVSGPNLVLLRPTIDDKGNVRYVVAGTKIGGPGFGYKLVKISRENVKTINGTPIDGDGVNGILEIPKTDKGFEDYTLEIKLFEYDPRLADAPAKLVDEFSKEKFAHKGDETTSVRFRLGEKHVVRPDRHYYITAFVLKNGKRTHIGEKDGKSGLCKVLTNGNPSSVKLIVRPVR